MNYGFDFLTALPFYGLLVMGIASLIPRAQHVADRIELGRDNPRAADLKPNLAQRVCLFLPGLCALWAFVAWGSPWAAVLLVVAYLVSFAAMIVFLRGPARPSRR